MVNTSGPKRPIVVQIVKARRKVKVVRKIPDFPKLADSMRTAP